MIYLYVYIYIYILTNLRSDVELSKMFQAKPNQTVLFLFPNLFKKFSARIHLCCLQQIPLN